jgi:hypothetical protein
MSRLLRQAFTLFAILAFLAVSTAALAHGHLDKNDTDESHCVMCRVAHGVTHLTAAPAIGLQFTAVQIGLLVLSESVRISCSQLHSFEGRAPPLA